MRLLLPALALVALVTGATAGDALAQVRVNPYFRHDGGYVGPHTRTYPNSTPYDNYGTYRRNNFAAPTPGTLPTFPN